MYVLRALLAKVVLLGAARDNILKIFDEANYAALSLDGGSMKYLFGDTEYALLVKYLEPNLALMVLPLRTVSAIDLIATAASSPDVNAEIARIETQVRNQLEAFSVPALMAKSNRFASKPCAHRTTI